MCESHEFSRIDVMSTEGEEKSISIINYNVLHSDRDVLLPKYCLIA